MQCYAGAPEAFDVSQGAQPCCCPFQIHHDPWKSDGDGKMVSDSNEKMGSDGDVERERDGDEERESGDDD